MRSEPGAVLRFSICTAKYCDISMMPFISMASSVMPSSRISWIHLMNMSPSLSGTPSMCAITRTGMWRVYCCAASQEPAAMNLSISSLQMAWARGLSLATSSAVNGGSISCLVNLWCGGSAVMGGEGIGGSGRTLRTITRRDEKCSVS